MMYYDTEFDIWLILVSSWVSKSLILYKGRLLFHQFIKTGNLTSRLVFLYFEKSLKTPLEITIQKLVVHLLLKQKQLRHEGP